MIRVLLADDHPAVRLGLERLVRAEPGMVHAGSVETGSAALAEVSRAHVDCVLVDYQMPEGGIPLCRRLKAVDPNLGIVIYTAFARERLRVAALVAGVNAVVDKSCRADRIFDAIRLAARGESDIHPSPAALADVAAELDAEQLPIFGMRIEGTPLDEIAETLRLDRDELEGRLGATLERIEARLGIALA